MSAAVSCAAYISRDGVRVQEGGGHRRRESLRHVPRTIVLRALVDVAHAMGVPEEEVALRGYARGARGRARAVLIWLLAEMDYSYVSIGDALGCDRSCARSVHRRYQERMLAQDPEARRIAAAVVRTARKKGRR